MQLQLTDNETRILIHVLEERLHELRNEIIHTSTRDYKLALKDHELALQCLHDKLVTIESLNAAA